MDIEKRFSLYEERYKHELESRERIDSRANSLLAFFAIVFAMIGYLFKETVLALNFNLNWTFWVVFVVSILSFVTSIIFFIRTIRGYEYLLMPTPVELEQYLEKTITEYSQSNPGHAKKWAKEVYTDYLFEGYIKYTTHNTQNNDIKSSNLDESLKYLIFAFLISSISYFPYYADLNKNPEKIHASKTAAATTTTATSSKRSTSSSSLSAASSSSRGAP